jgi:hypothetical protein
MNVYREGQRPERLNSLKFKEKLNNEWSTTEKIKIKVDRAPSFEVLAICAQRGIPIFFSRKATIDGYTKPEQIPIPYSYFVPGGRVLLDNTIFKVRGFPCVLEAALDDFLIVIDLYSRDFASKDKFYLGALDGNFESRYEAPFIVRHGETNSPLYQGTLANGRSYSVIANERYKGNYLELTTSTSVKYIVDCEYRNEPGSLRPLFSSPVHISGEVLFELIKKTEAGLITHNLFTWNGKKLIAKVNLSVVVFLNCHRFIKAGSSFGLKMFA